MTRRSLLLAVYAFYAFWYVAYALAVATPPAGAAVAAAVAMAALTFGFLAAGYLETEEDPAVGDDIAAPPAAEAAGDATWLDDAKLYWILKGVLVFQALAAVLAVRAILSLEGDYRELFFTSQAQIFGFSSFGLVFNVIAEYLAVVVFAWLLTRDSGSDPKFLGYLGAWVVLGTVVTLGRWFILYGLLVFLLQMARRGSIGRALAGLGTAAAAVGLAVVLFQCRGFSCEAGEGGLGDVAEAALRGIVNYFYLPVAMFDVYGQAPGYGPGLVAGYLLYPVHLVVNLLGGGHFDFEYARWATEVQDYVPVGDLGYYNAMVGQVLTSYVGAGLPGVFVSYLPLGFFLGWRGGRVPDALAPANVVAFFVLVFAHLIPVVSGPMFFFMLVFVGVLTWLDGAPEGAPEPGGSDPETQPS